VKTLKSGFNQLEDELPAHTDYSYDELVKIWNGAMRNGRLYRLGRLKRALLKGVVAFLRSGGRVVSSTIIKALEAIVQELRVTTRRRILRFGEAKVVEMRAQYARRGIFRWAPRLKEWLRDQAYKFWLGTLQITLEGSACLMVRAEPG